MSPKLFTMAFRNIEETSIDPRPKAISPKPGGVHHLYRESTRTVQTKTTMKYKLMLLLLIAMDVFLKVYSNMLPLEEFHFVLYPMHHYKPVSILTAVAIISFLFITVTVSGYTSMKILMWYGIASNVIERITSGIVTDMIPFPIGPLNVMIVANLADLYIIVGAISLAILFLKSYFWAGSHRFEWMSRASRPARRESPSE